MTIPKTGDALGIGQYHWKMKLSERLIYVLRLEMPLFSWMCSKKR